MPITQKTVRQIILLLLIITGVLLFFIFDLQNYLTLSYLRESKAEFLAYYRENPVVTIGIYFVIYIISVAFSFPGATILTLAGGTLFGLILGTIIISFASTIGATLAMVIARTLLRDYIQNKFQKQVEVINQKIEEEGVLYLFTLRLVPAFPFFVVNLVMGLTSMRIFTFAWISQVGMLAGTILYVNAGAELGKIEKVEDILSPSLLISFIILGLLPLILKKISDFLRKRAAHKSYDQNPISANNESTSP